MTGLLQVGINRPDGSYVNDPNEMETALKGSPYTLDRAETAANDGIAMIITATEWEAQRLMDGDGLHTLPSGYTMEVPTL